MSLSLRFEGETQLRILRFLSTPPFYLGKTPARFNFNVDATETEEPMRSQLIRAFGYHLVGCKVGLVFYMKNSD